ncbi:hypothetical protein Lser_V15G28037 [Lactuca serriola]
MDGHMGLANSLALKLSGVTSNMQDPVGGTISRNENGEPSGLMIDSAMKVVLSCVPEVSVEERRQALDRASRYAFMRGGTTVVDFGRYFPGASLEHPILRYCLIMSYWVVESLTRDQRAVIIYRANIYEPYVDEPWNIGLQVTDMESLSNMTVQSDKYGLQVAINAI